jgi:hypothetical protein
VRLSPPYDQLVPDANHRVGLVSSSLSFHHAPCGQPAIEINCRQAVDPVIEQEKDTGRFSEYRAFRGEAHGE